MERIRGTGPLFLLSLWGQVTVEVDGTSPVPEVMDGAPEERGLGRRGSGTT